ncbi:hypothetical protein N9L94_04470 [Robiginitalea sp.]|nr:hypothetical protein [Robiginitalea sp.]
MLNQGRRAEQFESSAKFITYTILGFLILGILGVLVETNKLGFGKIFAIILGN